MTHRNEAGRTLNVAAEHVGGKDADETMGTEEGSVHVIDKTGHEPCYIALTDIAPGVA